jgi:hypothetical protein
MRDYRRNYYCCVLAALLQLPAHAASVSLAWSPGADPIIAGYNLYFGGTSGCYTNRISVGKTTAATVSSLVPGNTYYFAMTTYGVGGLESPLSGEVSWQVPKPVSVADLLPKLDAIGNLTIGKNAGPQTVNLSGIGFGLNKENQALTIKAVSSNIGLIPHPTVNYLSPNTTGSLIFTPVANKTGTATIMVTINNGAPNNNVMTRKFTVKVITGPGAAPAVAGPAITGALTNQAALIGQTRNFTVKAAGKGSLRYQWRYNGAILMAATGPSLTLKNVSANQSGVYSVVVTDRNGSTNSAASLTVYATAAGTLASAGLVKGHYTLAVPSVPGCRYIVQASTDFANWVPVQTNIAPFTFVDHAAGQFNQRFYRAVYAP